jgi:glucokinase
MDIGGSNARVALVHGARLIAQRSLDTTSERSATGICDDLVLAAHELRQVANAEGSTVLAAGVGVAGQVDASTGTVIYAPNLAWHDVPLGACLANAIGIPVFVLNDVQAAAYGEWSHGAARGASDAAALFVGTGVGGGLITQGDLLRGCGGSAGELGHVTIELDGRECRCGRRGCVEAYAGGWAIGKRAREEVLARPEEGRRLLELAGSADALTAAHVAQAAREGDSLASTIVRAAAAALGAAIGIVANAFNPCMLVLGGGVIEGFPEMAAIAREAAHKRALPAAWRVLRIVPAALGDHAGTVGAAAWALRTLNRDQKS